MEIVEKITMPQKEKENIISQTVTKYGGKLMSYIRPKVKNTEDAEDSLQEVWYQFSSITNLSDCERWWVAVSSDGK